MRYINLGNSDLKVSSYCLGSMTWGQQTSEKDAWKQIEASLDAGINFVDTAEMYPTIPTSKETQGNTERIIGRWLETSKRRNDRIIQELEQTEEFQSLHDELSTQGLTQQPPRIDINSDNNAEITIPYENDYQESSIEADYENGEISNVRISSSDCCYH